MSRRRAAEHRSLAARAYGSHVARVQAGRPMPYSIDPPVLAEERALSHAPLDLARRDAGGQQLGARDHSMLRLGDPRQLVLH